jgi:hypothetical protein
MAQVLEIRDVPEEDVEESISDLKKLGATEVEKIKQADGTFTLRATFP